MHISDERITIFTVPKPFEGHIGIIQENAIKSWTLLEPRPQIILFGNEKGTDEIAKKLGVVHISDINCNEYGTPLLDSIFWQAQALAPGSIITYVNTDIILLNDFLIAVKQLQDSSFKKFLITGRRVDVDITEPLEFEQPTWETDLRHLAAQQGKLASVVCQDYFVFPKPLYAEIPSFAVGRGHWDHWVVYYAHQMKIPVVDATDVVTAIHQNHNYSHLSGGRGVAYVKGEEAKQNAKLAGGMHLVDGASANWKLTPSGLKKRKPLSAFFAFIFDLPRFGKLLQELFLRSQ
ncbi:putative glycosyl transferase [Nostoc sp. NIES-4103]|nr:putative glycosyl transferase [Nostoc sp. NIES-4103]